MKKLNNRGFAVSSVLYPLLILTIFLIVQVLTMMASRKTVLDKNKQQLLDSVNTSNKTYTNEELTILVTELQEENKNLKSMLETATDDSGWKSLKEGVNYRKIGSIAFVEFINYKPTTTGWQMVGNLPAEYKSGGQTRYGASVAFNGDTGNDIMTSISTAGQLNIYVNKTIAVVGMFVYPIG